MFLYNVTLYIQKSKDDRKWMLRKLTRLTNVDSLGNGTGQGSRDTFYSGLKTFVKFNIAKKQNLQN